MTKKLTHDEIDKQVLEALEGPLPGAAPAGNGQKQLPPGALKALIERAQAKKIPTREGSIK